MEDIVLLEAIEHYIKGELDSADLEHFEHLRKTNPEIDQLVVEHSFFLKQIEDYGAHKQFKSQLEIIHTDLIHEKEISVPKEVKVISWFSKHRKKLSVAATVAALFTITTLGVLFAYQRGKESSSNYDDLKLKVNAVDQRLNTFDEKLKTQTVHKPIVIPSTTGTGFCINENGYVITNYHVVTNSKELYVYNEKYGDLTAEVVAKDPANDLAILKITDETFKKTSKLPYSLINNDIDLGQRIYTLGYSDSNEPVYSEGFVSSKSANNALENKEKFLLTLQVGYGNSGSPIVNNNGEIIGVVAAREKQENGFAVGIKPSNIKNLVSLLNEQLETKITPSTKSTLARLSRTEQIKRITDYVFMVKIK